METIKDIAKIVGNFFFIGIGYVILNPKSLDEIKEDAQALYHAGYDYAKNELEGQKTGLKIAFLRQQRDVPFVTLGIYGDEIRIAVAKCNAPVTKDVYKFLKKFAKNYKLGINLYRYCTPPEIDAWEKEFAELDNSPKQSDNKSMKIHKETEVSERMKVVITNVDRKFRANEIASAMGALNYAGREHLRLSEDITGEGTLLGNVMVLDVNVPLRTSNSHDWTLRQNDFNMAVVRYLQSGKYAVTKDTTYGGFGNVTVGYVQSEPVTPQTLSIQLNTIEDVEAVRQALAGLGDVTINA